MSNVGKNIVQAEFRLLSGVRTGAVRFFDAGNIFTHLVEMYGVFAAAHTVGLEFAKGRSGSEPDHFARRLDRAHAQKSALANLARVLIPDVLESLVASHQPLAIEFSEPSFHIVEVEDCEKVLAAAKSAERVELFVFRPAQLLLTSGLVEVGRLMIGM